MKVYRRLSKSDFDPEILLYFNIDELADGSIVLSNELASIILLHSSKNYYFFTIKTLQGILTTARDNWKTAQDVLKSYYHKPSLLDDEYYIEG